MFEVQRQGGPALNGQTGRLAASRAAWFRGFAQLRDLAWRLLPLIPPRRHNEAKSRHFDKCELVLSGGGAPKE